MRIVNVLVYEDVRDTILVGWSYGGVAPTAAAERAAERLAHLVYLDSFIPQHGQAFQDLFDPAVNARFDAAAQAYGEGWRVPFMDPNVNDGRPRTALLVAPCKQPLSLTNADAARLPRTFILCTRKGEGPIDAAIRAAAARAQEQGWRYRELPIGHTAVWTMPREVAELLVEAAALPAATAAPATVATGVKEAAGLT